MLPECEKYEAFYEFYAPFDIQNFKVSEILVATSRKYNRLPPKSLWGNIMPTVIVLDELRKHLNQAISISSGYRTRKYNDLIPGSSKQSQHTAFSALDFSVRGTAPTEVVRILKEWRDNEKKFLIKSDFKRKAHRNGSAPVPFEELEIETISGKKYFSIHGGIGLYNTFVHLDMRGENRAWGSAD